MPVNTAALKTFAPAMRRQLLEAVGRKLDLLLHSQTPDTLSTYSKQIAELREQEAENREQLLEKVAYTWFNRLSALRYLDARGWHPFGCKVLMPAAEGETQPELLKLMRAGSLPAELKSHTNEARLHGLLDGQIPPAVAGADPQGEVYRELVLASCRSYHQLLPELFEGLDDASELLLPDDLLSEGSIAGGFRTAISDVDCEDVEIIGWLYQFYISEKKDQVIGKVVKSEDIPAATQLFTPNWIVKYMVQNSLGATWLATYPDSPLKGKMEFYIEPAEQSPEVEEQLLAITSESLDPEALTLIDPACGSGHILVEAYDLLKEIYLERGYRQRDIPELILTKNLYGLDICPRAEQLTAFSLLMKGREDDRRLLERGISLNVIALQDSTGLNVERLVKSIDLATAGLREADLRMLADLFSHATIFGSLIQVPTALAEKLLKLSNLADQSSNDLLVARDCQRLRVLIKQALILARRYDAVVANPPYMGSGGMNNMLKKFGKDHFANAKSDLFACFIQRSCDLSKSSGRLGVIAPYVWMFLTSYREFRDQMLAQSTLASLIQLEYNAFEPACVPVAAFIRLRRHVPGYLGSYIKLSDFTGHQNQAPRTLEAIRNPECGWFYQARPDEFRKIPGSPIAYSASEPFLDGFRAPKIGSLTSGKGKNVTADNDRFLRLWWEVDCVHVGRGKRWLLYAKGGTFRKWAGNLTHVCDWGPAAHAFYASNPSSSIIDKDYWYREGVTWTVISSSTTGFRLLPANTTFDTKGLALFFRLDADLRRVLLLLNSVVGQTYLRTLNQTFCINTVDVKAIPCLPGISPPEPLIASLIAISEQDWDAYERAWNFQGSPLLLGNSGHTQACSLEFNYKAWVEQNCSAIAKTKSLEEENNRYFIEAYGLVGELAAQVPIDHITLTTNPSYRYTGNLTDEEKWTRFRRDTIFEFLSYATGCMLGRYSLDQPGLILADSRGGQGAHLAAYEEKVGKPLSQIQFKPDADAIIPVLDGEWFEDDIVARTREFLEVTFPESSVTENLRFIEESLGKDIRKYFCSEFYKDHLQTYKKRPIYWMVQSPKKGFACLIYLHRYTKDTLNQVLNNYFRPYLLKLEAHLAKLGIDQLDDSLTSRERTAARKEAEKITKVLKECQAWEQDALLPLAQQRIELDLDDGVKVNYLKLQDVLAPIPGLATKED